MQKEKGECVTRKIEKQNQQRNALEAIVQNELYLSMITARSALSHSYYVAPDA